MEEIKCEDCCNSLDLFPDYASSGLWCSKCGIGVGDPHEDFPDIPERIFREIEFWNQMWDMASSYEDYNISAIEDEITLYGYRLAEKLSRYIPCEFLPLNSKLDKKNK
jgi:hypothetical protein